MNEQNANPVELFGMRVAHVGINATDPADALEIAELFSTMMGLPVIETPVSYFNDGSVRPGLTFRPVIFLRLHNGRPLSNLNPARGDAPETGRVARLALPFHADLPANSPSPRRAPAS